MVETAREHVHLSRNPVKWEVVDRVRAEEAKFEANYGSGHLVLG